MWLWLKDLLKVSVGTIIFGLILFAIGQAPFISGLISFTFGMLAWLAWELHRWEKKHGWD
jgi:hypothetical protein